jgi:collagen type IV alpha
MSTVNLSNLLNNTYQGELGFTGSQGATGFVGSEGFTGSQGDVGFTGSRGSTGFTGSQGVIGFTGSQGNPAPRALTVYNPTNVENITLFYTDVSISLLSVFSVLTGSTPSVTFSIFSGDNRTSSSTTHINSQTVTNTTTGSSVTIASANIPSNRWVWLTTSAISGTVESFSISINYSI